MDLLIEKVPNSEYCNFKKMKSKHNIEDLKSNFLKVYYLSKFFDLGDKKPFLLFSKIVKLKVKTL